MKIKTFVQTQHFLPHKVLLFPKTKYTEPAADLLCGVQLYILIVEFPHTEKFLLHPKNAVKEHEHIIS